MCSNIYYLYVSILKWNWEITAHTNHMCDNAITIEIISPIIRRMKKIIILKAEKTKDK